MRHSLCKEEYLSDMIQYNSRRLEKRLNTIIELKKDLDNNVQRHAYPTEVVIYNTKESIFHILEELMRSKYSIGCSCKEIEDIFYDSIQYMKDVEYDSIGYYHIVHYISLAILFETPKDIMQIFIEKIDDAKEDDILLDYLISAYGLKRNMLSAEYYKEKPYRELMEIISVAKGDKNKASDLLFDYTEKHWLKAHSDIDLPRLIKRDFLTLYRQVLEIIFTTPTVVNFQQTIPMIHLKHLTFKMIYSANTQAEQFYICI